MLIDDDDDVIELSMGDEIDDTNSDVVDEAVIVSSSKFLDDHDDRDNNALDNNHQISLTSTSPTSIRSRSRSSRSSSSISSDGRDEVVVDDDSVEEIVVTIQVMK